MLLATLWLVARLVAPATAMPDRAGAIDPAFQAALQTICHAGGSGEATEPGPAHVPDHGDCRLCPACHLAAQVAVPAPDGGGLLAAPIRAFIGLAAPLPPAPKPPNRPRLAARPTGPPSLSA